jgi:hypothetical protein
MRKIVRCNNQIERLNGKGVKRMRKVILVLMAVGLLSFALADLVSAASTENIEVTVTCRKLSVSISPSSYAFSTVNESSKTVASTSIGVTNDGNVTETFELKLDNTTSWALKQSGVTGADEFISGAIFKTTAPSTGDYTDSEDMLTTEYVPATTAVFAVGATAGEKGYSVLASTGRKLWLYFYAPFSTGSGTQQTFNVNIRATAS